MGVATNDVGVVTAKIIDSDTPSRPMASCPEEKSNRFQVSRNARDIDSHELLLR